MKARERAIAGGPAGSCTWSDPLYEKQRKSPRGFDDVHLGEGIYSFISLVRLRGGQSYLVIGLPTKLKMRRTQLTASIDRSDLNPDDETSSEENLEFYEIHQIAHERTEV